MRSLRILFLNTDYPKFLAQLYSNGQGNCRPQQSYAEQLQARADSLFGTADFASVAMRTIGWEAVDVHANNRWLQVAWLKQAEVQRSRTRRLLADLRGLPYRRRTRDDLHPRDPLYFEILQAQFHAFRPDVVYNQDPNCVSGERLRSLLPKDVALVAQIASPFDPSTRWQAYDLIISSLPSFVRQFRSQGFNALYQPLAFPSRVLDGLETRERPVAASFVGSLSPAHRDRVEFLETIARRCELQVWGDGSSSLSSALAIRDRHRGPAWGRDMFQILGRSRITLNKHIDIAGPDANNMRLFEATGVGALLITDWKENLVDLFEPGRDVVTYRSSEECADLISYYLAHESERIRISTAGQARCLRDHTYEKRALELDAILRDFVE